MTGVSVYEMFRTIGRAKLAIGASSAEEINAELRQLSPAEMVEEYHRSVVTLMSKGMLAPEEVARAHEYARSWVYEQAIGA